MRKWVTSILRGQFYFCYFFYAKIELTPFLCKIEVTRFSLFNISTWFMCICLFIYIRSIYGIIHFYYIVKLICLLASIQHFLFAFSTRNYFCLFSPRRQLLFTPHFVNGYIKLFQAAVINSEYSGVIEIV